MMGHYWPLVTIWCNNQGTPSYWWTCCSHFCDTMGYHSNNAICYQQPWLQLQGLKIKKTTQWILYIIQLWSARLNTTLGKVLKKFCTEGSEQPEVFKSLRSRWTLMWRFETFAKSCLLLCLLKFSGMKISMCCFWIISP